MSIVDRWVAEEIRIRKESGEEIPDEDALKEQLKKEFLDPSNWRFEGPDEIEQWTFENLDKTARSTNWWEDFNV